MRPKMMSLVFLFSIAENVAFAKPESRSRSPLPVTLPSVRIKLLAPAGWQEVGSKEVIANLQRIVLKDADLKNAVATRARLPQVAFAKHAPGYDSLNPSVKFVSQPAEGLDGVRAIQQAIDLMKSGVDGFQLVERPVPKQIAGRAGATARFKYKVAGYEVESRILVIVDGSELTIIGFTGTASGPDRCESEFQDLLKSIHGI